MSAYTAFDAFSLVRGHKRAYVLNEPLVWHIGEESSGWVLTIAAETVFDISVPRLLEWLQSPHDRQLLPCAAIHDELLKRGFDNAFSSAEFRRAAIARGIGAFRAWCLFGATLVWTVLARKKRRGGNGV